MNELKDAANESLTDGQPSPSDGLQDGNRPAASVAQPEPTKTQAPAGAPDAPVASPDAPEPPSRASGEPDAAKRWCTKCQAYVADLGNGHCPVHGIFLLRNSVARKHPIRVGRRVEIREQFNKDPLETARRLTVAQLAAVHEQLEVVRPGTPDFQRLLNAAQTLTENLRANAPEPEPPSQTLAQVPTSALTRYMNLLARLAAGEELTEREQGQLDVLQATIRSEIALAPDPPSEAAPVGLTPAPAVPPAVDPAPAAPAPRIQCAFMNPNGMQCGLDPMPGIAFCEYHSLDPDAHLKKENYELWLELHADSEEAIEVRRLRSTMVMLRTMFKPSPW